jgi:hypothetical protein
LPVRAFISIEKAIKPAGWNSIWSSILQGDIRMLWTYNSC